MTSVAAPGPVGTISLTGRDGQPCAFASRGSASRAPQSSARIKSVTESSPRLFIGRQCIIGAKAASFGRMRVNDELLLVGSIPLDTPKDVFETFGRPLGRYLFAMPDGEVGPRRHWISRVHYQVLAAHPELEVVQHPAPDENGVEQQFPRNAADAWWFKVRDGVKEVRFGDPGWRLGYARDAINSYFVFKVMKERGVLPPHLRFQVSIPTVNSVLPPRIFPDRADLDRIRPGSGAATRAEAAHIVDKIPRTELALQWD